MSDRREPIGATPDTIRIGQHVCLRDFDGRLRYFDGRRISGIVLALAVEGRALMVTVSLDTPIVLAARGEFGETRIYNQYVPVHEVLPFDERDEVIADLRKALQAMLDYHDDVAKVADQRLLGAGYAAINKAKGVA